MTYADEAGIIGEQEALQHGLAEPPVAEKAKVGHERARSTCIRFSEGQNQEAIDENSNSARASKAGRGEMALAGSREFSKAAEAVSMPAWEVESTSPPGMLTLGSSDGACIEKSLAMSRRHHHLAPRMVADLVSSLTHKP